MLYSYNYCKQPSLDSAEADSKWHQVSAVNPNLIFAVAIRNPIVTPAPLFVTAYQMLYNFVKRCDNAKNFASILEKLASGLTADYRYLIVVKVLNSIMVV